MSGAYSGIHPQVNGPGGPAEDAIERLLQRYEKASAVKDLWKTLFQEAYEYVFPQREGLYAVTEGEKRTTKIFDSTAVVAASELASRVQAYVMPVFAQWADLVPGSAVPEEMRDDVAEALEKATNFIFDTLQNSSFDSSLHEALLDYTISQGNLCVEEGDADNPIVFYALPLSEYCVERDPYGGVAAHYRCRQVYYRDLPILWPNGHFQGDNREVGDAIANKPDEKCTVLEATVRDWSNRGTEAYDFSVIVKDQKKAIWGGRFVGEGSCPHIVFSWAKSPSDTYGRGPVISALPDIKVLNLVIEMTLEHAELAIAGIYTAPDDGVINPDTITLVPGTVIPTAPGSDGLKAVPSAGDFNVANLVVQEMRTSIKKALYDDPLGDMTDTRIQSAQEVVERMADLSRRIGSNFGRLQTELVHPLIKRIVHILRRRGLLQIPRVNGREIRIRAISPLARSQSQDEVLRSDRLAGRLPQRCGPAAVNTMLKGEEAAAFLADNLGVPQRLVRTAAQQQRLLAEAKADMEAKGATPDEVASAIG